MAHQITLKMCRDHWGCDEERQTDVAWTNGHVGRMDMLEELVMPIV